ncbi:hypothetical protein F4801DRAFT_70253 [Xylaria longipes]|nr:hypothetical protein F4801DRAFT_70253 [Xylaria longipes]
MKHHHLLLALLASYPPSTICANTAAEIQGQEAPSAPSSTAIIITITAEADNQFTTTLPAQIPAPVPIAKRFQARQHIVAARTTSEVITSITTLPTPTPTPTPASTSSSDGDNNETSDGDGDGDEAPSSTITITITSNRTTTIRPTVTVTSLFSSIVPTTSGASGRLESLVSVNEFIRILLLIFSVVAVWV